jgi:hypothetical protein
MAVLCSGLYYAVHAFDADKQETVTDRRVSARRVVFRSAAVFVCVFGAVSIGCAVAQVDEGAGAPAFLHVSSPVCGGGDGRSYPLSSAASSFFSAGPGPALVASSSSVASTIADMPMCASSYKPSF